MRTRNKISAGVMIIRAGGVHPKIFEIFFEKISLCRKKVAQCRKYRIPDLNTLSRTIPYAYTLPNAIAYLNTCIPILIHALPILIH